MHAAKQTHVVTRNPATMFGEKTVVLRSLASPLNARLIKASEKPISNKVRGQSLVRDTQSTDIRRTDNGQPKLMLCLLPRLYILTCKMQKCEWSTRSLGERFG